MLGVFRGCSYQILIVQRNCSTHPLRMRAHGTGCGGLNIGGGAPELVTGSRDGMQAALLVRMCLYIRRLSERVALMFHAT